MKSSVKVDPLSERAQHHVKISAHDFLPSVLDNFTLGVGLNCGAKSFDVINQYDELSSLYAEIFHNRLACISGWYRLGKDFSLSRCAERKEY